MPKLRKDQLISTFIICLFLIFSQKEQTPASYYEIRENQVESVELIQVPNIPILINPEISQQLSEQVSALSYVALDLDSGSILVEKNKDQQLYPASTVKIMTALVAKDNYDLDCEVTVTKEAFTTGQTMGLQYKEKIKIRNLLAGLLINSGNDAAFTLASYHNFGYQGFIQEMNQKARDLGMSQTNYLNPSGLDEINQFSTAWDLAIVSQELLKDPELSLLVATQSMEISNSDQSIIHSLHNTNYLLNNKNFHGVKTGTTPLAGQVLISLTEIKEHPVLIVIMKSQDRYADTENIVDWISNNYDWEKI